MNNTLHYYNSNALLVINPLGLILVLYTPFRVFCTVSSGNIASGTWVYVDEVCSTDRDELVFLIYGQRYSYKDFQLKVNF